MGRTYSCWMLNCWCITWPVGFERLTRYIDYTNRLHLQGSTAPTEPRPPVRVSAITLRHATLSRTPLDEWLHRRRDLYLTTHSIHKNQSGMPPLGFELAIPRSELPQTHTLDRVVTRFGSSVVWDYLIKNNDMKTWGIVVKTPRNLKLGHP